MLCVGGCPYLIGRWGVSGMGAVCRVEMLGGLRAVVGDREIARFRTQKGGGLLAYLAYHLDRPHPREVLIELLWPWSSPAAGRHSLSVELSALRRQLEPPGVPTGAVIQADRTSVGLNSDAVGTDVGEFEAALAAAQTARDDPEGTQSLVEAVEAYHGPLLPGYYQDWILPEQDRLADLYAGAVLTLTGRLAQSNDLERAVEYARRAVVTQRLREDVHRNLMGLLAVSGQIDAALRQYEELERTLGDELGEAPSGQARALVDRISALRDDPEAFDGACLLPSVSAPAPEAVAAPVGTVALLVADLVGPASPDDLDSAWDTAVATLHGLLRDEAATCGGQQVQAADGLLTLVFSRPSQALTCGLACRQGFRADRPAIGDSDPRVRMALDTGEVMAAAGRYRGAVVDRAHGLLLAAHGGQIVSSEAAAAVLRTELPSGVGLRDLGYYRLRTVQEPERIFAVDCPETASEPLPRPNAAFAYRSNLPPEFTRFFGRQDELAQIRGLLLTEGKRLVTLTGPGGSGKTRLAIEAAKELSEAFRDAVWFVTLQDMRDPGAIPEAVVAAMGLHHLPELAPLDQACDALARQPCLLVLDNFEHLIEGGAGAVQQMLERVSCLQCIVTSRQRLNLGAEGAFPVAPLPVPEADSTLDDLLSCPSSQLFVDRAQAARPDFGITDRNSDTVAALCGHLEGIPLALELAAARVQVIPPARMLEQIDERFGLLVSRRRDVTERHRTLRAACDWSYGLLTPQLQRLFAGLSVFRGGWTVEAAQVVCQAPHALELLEELCDCSLVLADPREGSRPGPRFRMLEMLREYGRQTLPENTRGELQRRHAEHYLAFAQQVGHELADRHETRSVRLLEVEQDNLLEALHWFTCAPNGAEAAMRLAESLLPLWEARGRYGEGRAHLAAVLSRQDATEHTGPRARALYAAGRLAVLQLDHEAARRLYGEAVTTCERGRHRAELADALSGLGWVASRQQEFTKARELFEQALALAHEVADSRRVATMLVWLGGIYLEEVRLQCAEPCFREALGVARESGDSPRTAHSLVGLAQAAYALEDFGRARSLAAEAVAIQRERDNPAELAHALEFLARTVMRQGDHRAAQELREEILAIRSAVGHLPGIAEAQCRLAGVLRESGELRQAEVLLRQCLDSAREQKAMRVEARALRELGQVVAANGDYPQGRDLMLQGQRIYEQLGASFDVMYGLSIIGNLAWEHGDLEGARLHFEQALAARRELGVARGIVESLVRLALVAAQQGDHGAALAFFRQGLTAEHEPYESTDLASCMERLAAFAGQQRATSRAARLYGAAEAFREAEGCPVPGDDREDYDTSVASLRDAMDEATLSSAWAEGREMTWEEAVAYALQDADPESTPLEH